MSVVVLPRRHNGVEEQHEGQRQGSRRQAVSNGYLRYSLQDAHYKEIHIRKATKLLKQEQGNEVPWSVLASDHSVVHKALFLVGRWVVHKDLAGSAGRRRRRSQAVDGSPHRVAIAKLLPDRFRLRGLWRGPRRRGLSC
jgi:hypothetical protein